MGVLFFCAVSLYLLAGAGSLAAVVLVAVLYGIGVGAGQPALQAQSTKEVKLEQVGIAVSTCYLGNDIGQGIGPVLGGMVSDWLGYGAMFFGAALLHSGGRFSCFIFMNQSEEVLTPSTTYMTSCPITWTPLTLSGDTCSSVLMICTLETSPVALFVATPIR